MKKIFVIVLLFFIFALTYFIKNFPITNIDKNQVFSQIQYSLYSFDNNYIKIELSFGEREEPFNDDGKPTKNVGYSLLEVEMINKETNTNFLFVNIKINNKTNRYKLRKNPFKNSFVEDIKINNKSDDIFEVNIENLDNNFYKLNCITNLFKFSYKDAQKRCIDEYNNYFFYILNNNKKFECDLTIAKGYEAKIVYFWKLKILATDFEQKYALFDTNTLDLILKT